MATKDEASRRAWGEFQLTKEYTFIPRECRLYTLGGFFAGFAAGMRASAEHSDDYEAGYAEGFHHGLSAPRGSAEDDRGWSTPRRRDLTDE